MRACGEDGAPMRNTSPMSGGGTLGWDGGLFQICEI
jgi:hypothetical protein